MSAYLILATGWKNEMNHTTHIKIQYYLDASQVAQHKPVNKSNVSIRATIQMVRLLYERMGL